MAPGDRVEIDGPYGMAYLREDAPRDILCLAGGSGLSPMISITRAAAVSPVLAGRTIHLVHGGRTAKDICGAAMIQALPGFGGRLRYHPCTSAPEGEDGAWSGLQGFVHDVATALFGEALGAFEIYFAGPPAMAAALRKMFFEMKVPPAQIHFDEFY
jgi:toluene monooxygenase electron transfer component